MSVLRRIAIGFPTEWSHRRAHRFDAVERPGAAPYFVEWDAGNGTYGEQWNDAPRDAGGVLLSGTARDYHPIRIAQFALHRYERWHDFGDPDARRDMLAQAAWLRDAQREGGLYVFDFPWSKYGAPAGWSSAMAQGEAISVLLRAHDLEPRDGYGDAAVRAAAPFRREIGRGGVTWSDGADVFFEEIANRHAPHVLNGCIFALWGLWELSQSSGELWMSRRVSAGVDTIVRWLPRYDTGWWSLYGLLRSAAGRPHLATLKYHQFHIAQLRVLAEMFGDPAFTETADRWTQYGASRANRARLLVDTACSLPDRFLGRDAVAGGATT